MTAAPPVVDLLKGVKSGAWLDAQVFPPLSYAVPGIISEGFGLFVGPPKVGKSFAAYGIAIAVASGTKAFGCVPTGDPRPVFYLALEDGDRRLQERGRALTGGAPLPPLLEYVTEAPSALAMMQQWLDVHAESRPLVILDTLGKVGGNSAPGESAYGRDYRIGSALKRLSDSVPGCTLLAVHHDRKAATEDFVDAVSGTHGLAGASDFLIVLDRKRQETSGTLKVTGRDVTEAEYGLEFDGGRWSLIGESLRDAAAAATTVKASSGLGPESVKVVEFVSAHPEGVTPALVAEHCGMPPNAAATYLGRLVTAGRLSKAGRGKYTPLPLSPVVSVGSVVTDESASEVVTTVPTATPPAPTPLFERETNRYNTPNRDTEDASWMCSAPGCSNMLDAGLRGYLRRCWSHLTVPQRTAYRNQKQRAS